jgi:LacI family transcriptional regulator
MSQPYRILISMYTHSAFDRSVLRGIARYARLNGKWTFYLPDQVPHFEVDDSPTLEQRRGGNLLIRQLRKWGATGFIGRIPTNAIGRKMLQMGLPLIAMELSAKQQQPSHQLFQVSEIHPNSHEAGRMVAEHYLGCGLQRFAYCGIGGRLWSERRREGFTGRLQEACFSCDVHAPLSKTSPTWDEERLLIRKWIKSLRKPVGIMACNDIRGRQVLEACMIEGLKVPEEVAVIGVDNDELLCDLTNPPLSSIQFDGETVGYRAAELLAKMMSGEKVKKEVLLAEPLKVIVRRSTDVVAVDDPRVASAMRFIRENVRGSIGVEDVVEHVNVSRRTLEIHFQRHLMHSIRREIQLVRLNLVKQFLAETDISLRKIAGLAGFEQYTHLCQVFRQETGMTLLEYRQHSRQGVRGPLA